MPHQGKEPEGGEGVPNITDLATEVDIVKEIAGIFLKGAVIWDVVVVMEPLYC